MRMLAPLNTARKRGHRPAVDEVIDTAFAQLGPGNLDRDRVHVAHPPVDRDVIHGDAAFGEEVWVPRTTSPSLTSAFAASRPQHHRR